MLRTITGHSAVCGNVTGRFDVSDEVKKAMLEVPRHKFVPEFVRDQAYEDCPLPIGHDKTISQPFIVALMIDLLDLTPNEKVLEVGTGLGYQAAVLSRVAGEVYTIDIISELASEAAEIISGLNYDNVTVQIGNGQLGWPEHAPFDKVIAAASADSIPNPLLDQLRIGGVLVMPVGAEDSQVLIRVEKSASGWTETSVLPVRFSRMVVVH